MFLRTVNLCTPTAIRNVTVESSFDHTPDRPTGIKRAVTCNAGEGPVLAMRVKNGRLRVADPLVRIDTLSDFGPRGQG